MRTLTLNSPSDILNKLHRERYRAFHAQHPTHKADHLYNFCVTSIATRDFVFKVFNYTKGQKKTFFDNWNQHPALVACLEIANLSKHLILRNGKSPKTQSVSHGVSSVVEFFEDTEGNISRTLRNDYPDYEIILSDGASMNVYEFTESVIQFWKKFFVEHSIAYRQQSNEELLGVHADPMLKLDT